MLYSSSVSRTRSAITAGSSSRANSTVRSNPCGPVDEDAEATPEGIGGDPRFVRATRVPATGDHGRLDSFSPRAGDGP